MVGDERSHDNQVSAASTSGETFYRLEKPPFILGCYFTLVMAFLAVSVYLDPWAERNPMVFPWAMGYGFLLDCIVVVRIGRDQRRFAGWIPESKIPKSWLAGNVQFSLALVPAVTLIATAVMRSGSYWCSPGLVERSGITVPPLVPIANEMYLAKSRWMDGCSVSSTFFVEFVIFMLSHAILACSAPGLMRQFSAKRTVVPDAKYIVIFILLVFASGQGVWTAVDPYSKGLRWDVVDRPIMSFFFYADTICITYVSVAAVQFWLVAQLIFRRKT